MQFAYKFKNISPTKSITKRVAAKTFGEATEKVSERYGAKIAGKVVSRIGGTFVPGPGWVVAGGLITIDLGWYLYDGTCTVCDASKYLYSLLQEHDELQIAANPVPTLTHDVYYRVLPTSFAEIQAELNHVRALVEADPWGYGSDTRAHREYKKQLEAELAKRKFS